MPTPQGTTREEARAICAEAVLRNGSYDPAVASNVARLDRAIDAAFSEFCNGVRNDLQNDTTLVLTAGNDTLDTYGISGFDPDRFVDGFLLSPDGVPIEIRFSDYKDALGARKGVFYPSNWVPGLLPPFVRADGQETVLAGWGPTRWKIQFAQVFTENMTLSLSWFSEFNRAAAGTGTKFNVPRMYCDQICYFGVPCYYDSMQIMAPQQGNPISKLREQFDKLIAKARFPGMTKALNVRPPL